MNLAQLDLLLISSNVVHHTYLKSEERNLQRYEFIEFIMRTAIFRYIDPNHYMTDKVQAIEALLAEHIYPNAKTMNGEAFRKYHCYNVKTNEILKKNEPQITKLYKSFCHSKKSWLTLEDVRVYVRSLGFRISELYVGAIYSESMMTIVDTIRDPSRVNQMTYVEFIVFLCRICHEHYEKSQYKKEPLYIKLDHMMERILSYVNQ